MTSFEFEGRSIPFETGDTIASALFRAGVRVFSRSFKYHRPRGLYCLTGDCPNCLLTIDGEPCERACCTMAAAGQCVRRENAWPSADFDLLATLWHLRALFPVGFYYKTMIRPRFLWPMAEPLIRRIAGIGTAQRDVPPSDRETCHHHPDVLVIGGGVAGLSASVAAAEGNATVLLVDEGAIGEKVAPGPTCAKIDELRRAVAAKPNVTVMEHAQAVGVYEGPLVPVNAQDFLHLVHPNRIIVATGAVDQHPVFPGNDLPGVWLGRGAARMNGVHGVSVGSSIVFVGMTDESMAHLDTLTVGGAHVVAAIVPERLMHRVPSSVRRTVRGDVVAARGRKNVRRVIVESDGRREAISCDALVLSLGLQPRDSLLRQGNGFPVNGAGDVILPGCSFDEAIASGIDAVRNTSAPLVQVPVPAPPAAGFVCLCEDVTAREFKDAWAEGFQSTELLKRYTTATMGPCQGALCHCHLRAFVSARTGDSVVNAPTTARPPARPIRLEDVAAGLRFAIEHRTALHERHVGLGADMTWFGGWKRPNDYGNELDEYWAVRRNVSAMDVGTLGKFLIAGRDANEFLERLYPSNVHDIAEGRQRYSILLNEAGYLFDDGLICRLPDNRYYITFTSAGSEAGEAWLWNWIQEWKLNVHVVNQTGELGAINVAGPRARELLQKLTSDALDNESFRFSTHRKVMVAGVQCRVLRVGFVGELSYELHHPSSQSTELWDAVFEAGAPMDIQPHGMQALLRLRLEKGHLVVGLDTDFDSSPSKLGLDWLVKLEKPYFVGKTAVQRLATIPVDTKLLPIRFAGTSAPAEGAVIKANGGRVGHVTSARFSPVLEYGVALGWVSRTNGEYPTAVEADGITGAVTSGPFYDPKGEKLRA